MKEENELNPILVIICSPNVKYGNRLPNANANSQNTNMQNARFYNIRNFVNTVYTTPQTPPFPNISAFYFLSPFSMAIVTFSYF